MGQKSLLNRCGLLLGGWPKSRPQIETLVRTESVPSSLRGQLWIMFSNSDYCRRCHPKISYRELLGRQSQCAKQISVDIKRSCPNDTFKAKMDEGRMKSLHNVLTAYSIFDPNVGYCQGMNFVVAMLLLYLDEETAFWVFVSLMKYYRIEGFFKDSLPMLSSYLGAFDKEIEKKCPRLGQYFTEHDVSSSLFATNWFSTLFVYALPEPSAASIMDMLFIDGKRVMFRVGVFLIKSIEEKLLNTPIDSLLAEIKSLVCEFKPQEIVQKSLKVSLMEETLAVSADEKMYMYIFDDEFDQPENSEGQDDDTSYHGEDRQSSTGSNTTTATSTDPGVTEASELMNNKAGKGQTKKGKKMERTFSGTSSIDIYATSPSFKPRGSRQRGELWVPWDPDETAQTCTACVRKFTTFRRKHHCRNCGRIFCDACASQRRTITKLGYKTKVRVCNNCTTVLDHQSFLKERRKTLVSERVKTV
eukprot:GFYU01002362.1.p1 GENE.GFYU01002362.1~~GFYU01002362.1.p1  ORF type:complete len:472 (-),score=103.04 GFYU01002362.1:234-1649(-)